MDYESTALPLSYEPGNIFVLRLASKILFGNLRKLLFSGTIYNIPSGLSIKNL